jgi:hypothetical protein
MLLPLPAQFSAAKKQNPVRYGASSGIPWDVSLAQNQLLNRVVMDAAGPIPWDIALSRTKYERLEHILSAALYLLVGIALPIGLEKIFNKWFTKNKLAKWFDMAPEKKPLRIPFKYLEHNGIEQLKALPEAERQKILGKYGIKEMTPKLAKVLKLAKAQIILVDLLLFATKGVVYFWGRNWLTAKWSGKEGFSGILNYANQGYLQKQNDSYQKNKKKRFMLANVLGYGTSVAVPVALLGVLRSPKAIGQGAVGRLKKLLPVMDYHNAIYMSKELFLLSVIANYNIPKLLASRDSNERRENLVRMGIHDSFYFFGDGLLTSSIAWFLQKKNAERLGNVHIVEMKKRAGITMPFAVPYHKMMEQEGEANQLAFQLARKSFWAGLTGTTFLMGISIPLLNRWYTRKKVLSEQSKMAMQKTQSMGQTAGPFVQPWAYRNFTQS